MKYIWKFFRIFRSCHVKNRQRLIGAATIKNSVITENCKIFQCYYRNNWDSELFRLNSERSSTYSSPLANHTRMTIYLYLLCVLVVCFYHVHSLVRFPNSPPIKDNIYIGIKQVNRNSIDLSYLNQIIKGFNPTIMFYFVFQFINFIICFL